MSCGLRQCCLCAVVGTLLQWRMGLCSINIGRIFPWLEPPICPCERWFSVLVMRFIFFPVCWFSLLVFKACMCSRSGGVVSNCVGDGNNIYAC